jgi:hypothetical protein
MASCSRYFDLTPVISLEKSSVVGGSPGESLENVLSANELFVHSDADEELLFHFYFQNPVKIHSLKLRSSTGDEEMSGPLKVRLFANNPTIDFSEAADTTPTQEMEFRAEQLEEEGEEVKLQFVKFQLVKSLTLFVAENQDDTDSTKLDQIQLIGTPTAGTDMSKLQKGKALVNSAIC